ncbi:MAG: hypothetical protein WCI55_14115 [Armatimonadota bacterium]
MLSDLVWGFVSPTRNLVGNLDSSFFDSMEGTVESIKDVLLGGRFADAYSLLRRFMDTTRMQVYVMHCLRSSRLTDDFDALDTIDSDSEAFLELVERIAQNYYVENVEKWLTGDLSMKVLKPSQFGSATIDELNSILDKTKYQLVLDRCNEHLHMNYYKNLRLNHTNIDNSTQLTLLSQFSRDFRHIYIWHLAHVFTLHPEYMASTDYVDALDCGEPPEEGSQNWVAPVVQEVFDLIITPYSPDVTNFIRENGGMELC